MFQPLLCFVPCVRFDCCGRLVGRRDPGCDAGLGSVAEDVCIDCEHELVVGVFESGGGEDGG